MTRNEIIARIKELGIQTEKPAQQCKTEYLQSLLETKIAKLKNVVASARIIDESQLDVSKILIHSKIKIKNTVPTIPCSAKNSKYS